MAADDIVELFSAFGPVSVRRMFGGAGVYADGTMFALIVDGAIHLKAGPNNAQMFEREGLPPFTYSRREHQQAVMSYRRMPDRLYDDPDELAGWAHAALAAAHAAKPRAKPEGRDVRPSRAKKVRASKLRPGKSTARKSAAKKSRAKKKSGAGKTRAR